MTGPATGPATGPLLDPSLRLDPISEADARRIVAAKAPRGQGAGPDVLIATRAEWGGWVLRPVARPFRLHPRPAAGLPVTARPVASWVVTDTGRACRLALGTRPEFIITRLIRSGTAPTPGGVPGAWSQDAIDCECGHPSGQHDMGQRTRHPLTGEPSVIGRGPCQRRDACDCTRLLPAGRTVAA